MVGEADVMDDEIVYFVLVFDHTSERLITSPFLAGL